MFQFFSYCCVLSTRCLPCACHPVGSVNGSCHPDSGVCTCKLLVVGAKCDACQPGASHFDPESHFGCSKGEQTHTHTHGETYNPNCFSVLCWSWHLINDLLNMDEFKGDWFNWHFILNYSLFMSQLCAFICSAPSQQPPPAGFALNYSSIQLSWNPPDSPNSNKLNYTLIRNGHTVHSIQSHYPFSKYKFQASVMEKKNNFFAPYHCLN